MGRFKTDTIIFIGLLILGSIILLLTAEQSTIDIQLHDTYFVLDKISLTFWIVGPLTFLIFLVRGLTRKFKTIWTNMALIVGVIFVMVITYQVVRLQQSHFNEMMRLDGVGLSDSKQFIVDAKNRISWTWGLLNFWGMGLLLLSVRTIKIWREGYSN